MAILDKVFKAAIDHNASHVHVVPGEPFTLRRLGRLTRVKSNPLTPDQSKKVIFEILSDEQKKYLERDLQLDFALERPDLGRFRGSAIVHQNGLSAVFRVIPQEIPTFEDLGLPETIARVLDNHQGLILVTGDTEQGKSTTLAAMIDYINTNRAYHIITIEDPIEFIHPIKKGVISQRQLGLHTLSYSNAIKAALRADPDVIVMGELRDLETISLAIPASESGHLVIGTLSTSSAPKAIDRVIDSFPPNGQSQTRTILSEVLRAVITQRLIPAADGKSMALALEILIGTLPLANLIRDSKTFQIPSLMERSKSAGMQLMDLSILELLQDGKISAQDAYSNASNPNLFKKYLEE